MPSVGSIVSHWRRQGYEAQKFICMECQQYFLKLERAHIVAKCDGGADDVDNLVLVCRTCHVLTDGRTKEMWVKKLLGDGIGSLKLKNIHIPADFILRCQQTESDNPTSKKILDLLEQF